MEAFHFRSRWAASSLTRSSITAKTFETLVNRRSTILNISWTLMQNPGTWRAAISAVVDRGRDRAEHNQR